MHHAEATRLPTRPILTPVSTPLHAQPITGFSLRPGEAAVRVRGGQGAPLARRAVRPPPRRRRLCHGDARVQPRALTRPRQHPQPLRSPPHAAPGSRSRHAHITCTALSDTNASDPRRVVRLLLQALRHRLVLAGPVGRLPRRSRAAPHPERARRDAAEMQPRRRDEAETPRRSRDRAEIEPRSSRDWGGAGLQLATSRPHQPWPTRLLQAAFQSPRWCTCRGRTRCRPSSPTHPPARPPSPHLPPRPVSGRRGPCSPGQVLDETGTPTGGAKEAERWHGRATPPVLSTSHTPRLYLHLGCTSAAPRLHLGAASWLVGTHQTDTAAIWPRSRRGLAEGRRW